VDAVHHRDKFDRGSRVGLYNTYTITTAGRRSYEFYTLRFIGFITVVYFKLRQPEVRRECDVRARFTVNLLVVWWQHTRPDIEHRVIIGSKSFIHTTIVSMKDGISCHRRTVETGINSIHHCPRFGG